MVGTATPELVFTATTDAVQLVQIYGLSVTDVWNNLPQEAVAAKSVKDFEIAIDKHWENQEMKYNHNANIELKTGRKR